MLAVALSLLSGVVGVLSHPDFAAETRGALGVMALFALASPIVSLLSSGVTLPSLGDIDLPDYGDGYVETLSDAYQDGLVLAIADYLSLDDDIVSVSVGGISLENMRAERISVALGREAVFSDTRALKEWIKEEFLLGGGECEVVIGFD